MDNPTVKTAVLILKRRRPTYFVGIDISKFKHDYAVLDGIGDSPSQLRYALMNCYLPLITHEPVFAEYYVKKRAEGKTHRVALTHVAKKLLWVIYALQTKNLRYDPNLIR